MIFPYVHRPRRHVREFRENIGQTPYLYYVRFTGYGILDRVMSCACR